MTIRHNVMQERHYEQVARAMRNAVDVAPVKEKLVVLRALRIVARSLGSMNNNFNIDRFYHAAGISHSTTTEDDK